jgi:hypothetical protein
VAAHAVGDDEERELLVDEVVVFVVVTDPSDIGGGEEPDIFGQAHACARLPEAPEEVTRRIRDVW